LSEWTAPRTPHEGMHHLQAAGGCAGAGQDAAGLNEVDPQVAHRGTMFELDHPVIGPAKFEGSPVLFSHTQQDNWRSAPLLGEDNRYVLTTMLGLDDDEVDQLTAEGVI